MSGLINSEYTDSTIPRNNRADLAYEVFYKIFCKPNKLHDTSAIARSIEMSRTTEKGYIQHRFVPATDASDRALIYPWM